MNRIAAYFLFGVSLPAGAWAHPQSGPPAADVFAKCSARYKQLKTYVIEADQQTEVSQIGRAGSFDEKTVLAVSGEGRVFIDFQGQEGREIRVSNGVTTWKALPSEKAWAKEEVAQMTDDPDEADQAGPADIATRMQRELVQRYTILPRYAGAAEFLKQDCVKFGGVKTVCYVYRIPIGKSSSDLWIAADTYYVLRHIENIAPAVRITTDYKRIDAGNPDASLFDFRPPGGKPRSCRTHAPG